MRSRPLAALLLLAPAAAAQTATFAETFDGGSNVGAWTWTTFNETISPLNGNPGAFLQDLSLVSCCPEALTAVDSVYVGDYRAMGVTSLGIDLVTLDADFSVANRPLTLGLWNDNGTQFFFGDDWGAYFVGDKDVPTAGVASDAGWTSFDFEVPAHLDELPAGWVFVGPPDKSWADLVRDVDVVGYYYGVPGQIYIVMGWDVGLDNPRITFADCNGNGAPDNEDVLGGGSSDFDLDGAPDECQAFHVDVDAVSVSAGGTQTMSLEAGPDHAGEAYLVLGSLSGTQPGLPLGPVLLPLNLDAYFVLTIKSANQPPLVDTFGTLGPGGSATASFQLAPGSPASLVGLQLSHAFAALDPVSFAVQLASNAMPLRLDP